jgi:protein-S-isoprenylcysteine O-methyltransferase Ste14
MSRAMSSLVVRNVLFAVVVPGAVGVYVPWLILTRHGALPSPAAWYALPLVILGVFLYLSCVRVFAVVGRGTPGLWDPPRRFVAAGPYRWVRNPIYVAAVLIVSGEAWLFGSPDLLLYAAGLAVAFHLFVVGYEEPRLRARFGEPYETYRRTVPRWIPRPPQASNQHARSVRSSREDRHRRTLVQRALIVRSPPGRGRPPVRPGG